MKTITREQIASVLPGIDLLPAIENGFAAYSEGRAVVPPVGELILDKGEVHIKYGYIKGEDYYVIKIASGFYGNAALGLPSGNGAMLLYSQETGEPAPTPAAHKSDVHGQTCPYCDSDVEESFPFCASCKTELSDCPECGKVVSGSLNECPHCGCALGGEENKD